MPRPAARSVSGTVADDAELGPEISSQLGVANDGDGPKSGQIVDAQELLDALTCPVSGLVFVDPVTTTCGHTFSRQSLARWMSSGSGSDERAGGAGPSCPTCRAPLYHESPHQWPVNTVLVDLAERFLKHDLAEARQLTYKQFGLGASGTSDGVRSTGEILGELPLFVLDSMTPGQELTLNVFEERYKLMIRRCLRGTRKFGMVGLARPAGANVPNRPGRSGADGEVARELGDTAAGALAPSANVTHGHTGASRLLRYIANPPGQLGRLVHLDHAVECNITAFQELLDGRLLLRCRAVRHLRIVDSRDEPGGAGYTCATVEAVTDTDSSVTDTEGAEGAGIRDSPRDVSPAPQQNIDYIQPEFRTNPGEPGFTVYGPAARAVLAACVNDPVDARDAARAELLLSSEMAVGMHHVWLAHVAGRTIGWQRPVDDESPVDDLTRWSPPTVEPEPWVCKNYPVGTSGTLGSRGGEAGAFPSPNDFLRRSYGGDVENLLSMCGSRPAAHLPTELSWWLVRVANPLPPLGAARELRPDALRCTSATQRFDVVYWSLVASMKHRHGLEPAQFRGARPMADAALVDLVNKALKPVNTSVPGVSFWSPGVNALRSGEDADPSFGHLPVTFSETGTTKDSKGRAYRNASAEDVEALIGVVTQILERPLEDAGETRSPSFVSPSDFEGPGPAMRLPPVPPNLAGNTGGVGPPPRVPPGRPGASGAGSETAELTLEAVARRGGVPTVCWCLYLRLSSMPPNEWDECVSRIIAALQGLESPNGPPRVPGTVIPLTKFAPQPGDWFVAGQCVGRRRALLAGRVGASYGRVAGATVGAFVWVYYLVCELFLLTCLAFGLLGPRDGNRLPHRLVKGIGLALAAAVLFGVLSYVP